ncbi:hypothetical proteinVVA0209 [Candidatus Vecturithrix granuli]|uniref:Solute-binding protein family 3/N-terminal domain-containing protein n=1 Tax=Vecturithrix granuli TaxID=1499967 RepID=A0A081C669_VECG1|nr:hypothetical proteinVVA0209 [Candidatus Vecturithrix granuli]
MMSQRRIYVRKIGNLFISCLSFSCFIAFFLTCLLCLAGIMGNPGSGWALETLPIISEAQTVYEQHIKNQDPYEQLDYHGLTRTEADLALIWKALHEGGLKNVNFTFIESRTLARNIQMVKDGEVVLFAHDLPVGDFEETVFMTIPIIPPRRFEKGIYTIPSHTELLKVKTLEELKNFTAVSSRSWVADWEILEKMQLKKVFDTVKFQNMLDMVANGRVDFAVLDFPNREDLNRTLSDGNILTPVPGVKIVLDVSRHFMVSRKHPDGQLVFEALQKGLKILEERGEIERALTECGFYHEKVKDWKILN